MHIEDDSDTFTISYEWLDHIEAPLSLVATELVFKVQLVRTATREHVLPLKVETPRPPTAAAYEEFFGRKVQKGKRFDLEDLRDQLQQMQNMGGMGWDGY